MNLKNLTPKAKIEIFKRLVEDLDMENIGDNDSDFKISPIRASIDEAKDRIAHPDRLDGLSTGYPSLDKITGGFAPEELIVIGGGTGTGKTQFIQCIMLNMALNSKPSLFFTLEMSAVETTIRFMKMIKSKCDPGVTIELPIHFYEGNTVNLNILEEAIKQGKEQGIECVFIDHLHFFARSVANQSAEIGNITRTLKLLARKYKLPIVLVSHIRKLNNVTAVPGLDDLRDSSFIAQDADMVIMLWRDTEEKQSTMLKVRVKKSRRRGILDGFELHLDYNSYLSEGENYEVVDLIRSA